MFLAIGLNETKEPLDHEQLLICKECGSYGRYDVYMTCLVLYLFFMPVWRFRKRYFVEMSCCHALYELNGQTGKAIEKGEAVRIQENDLQLLAQGNSHSYKRCAYCGYQTEEDFAYCPKCGRPL